MMGAVWNLIMAQASVLGLVNVPLNLKITNATNKCYLFLLPFSSPSFCRRNKSSTPG